MMMMMANAKCIQTYVRSYVRMCVCTYVRTYGCVCVSWREGVIVMSVNTLIAFQVS